MSIRKLTPGVHPKVWGSPLTEPWLKNDDGGNIGEIWYSATDVLPLLIKFLFTSERLSVQVHPGDLYAQAHGGVRGKTEMWHILRAAPDARIALGLRERISKDRLREAALSGEIVDLLDWIPARPGDTFFVPAGTIHAIGGGLALCEVQQYSDLTYRLFDYQRQPERPLHLDDSLAVARLEPGVDGARGRTAGASRELLAECPYFRAERLNVRGIFSCATSPAPRFFVAVEGAGWIAGEPFRAGEAWLAPAGAEPFSIGSPGCAFVLVDEPHL